MNKKRQIIYGIVCCLAVSSSAFASSNTDDADHRASRDLPPKPDIPPGSRMVPEPDKTILNMEKGIIYQRRLQRHVENPDKSSLLEKP